MEREICRINELTDDLLKQRIGAKIAGTENLAKVFKGREPDFMLLFSSAEAYVGSTGWSTYTSGCSYQTQIVQRISQQGVPTFAVNWGFWEGVDENIVEMLKNKGLRFLNIRDGINVIRYVLGNQCHQLIALKAEDRVVDQMGFEKLARPQQVISSAVEAGTNVAVQGVAKQTESASAPVASVSGEGSLSRAELNQENLQKALISLFSQVLKLDESDMDANEDMLNYGVDSLIVLNIQTELENRAGQVSVNLLLENQTISDIATTMLTDYREQAAALLGTGVGTGAITEIEVDVVEPSSELDSSALQAELKAMTPAVPENLSVLRAMTLDEGETFLQDYHKLYQNKALMTEPLEGAVIEDYAADGMLHGLVDSGQGNMEVFVSGQGIPVVLMPAVAVTAPTWLYLLNSRLREKYQFIVVHPPGYGMSEPVKECNTKGIVSAVLGALDALGIRRPFHLVGSCLGCAASIYLAKSFPERVASLTLVGAFHDTSDLNVSDPDNMSGAQFEELAKSAVESLHEDFQAVIDNLKETDAWQADIITERRDLLLNSQCVNFLVALRYLNEMMSMSLLPWLPEVGVATHCIYGDVDRIITPRHSKEISQGIKGAQLTCIPGSAHFPYLTHEKMFVPVLEGFIDDQERKQMKTVTGNAMESVN
jgi:pimeloyl-ACP methyl ester carboxylesterase/aryl carrier-like protein